MTGCLKPFTCTRNAGSEFFGRDGSIARLRCRSAEILLRSRERIDHGGVCFGASVGFEFAEAAAGLFFKLQRAERGL